MKITKILCHKYLLSKSIYRVSTPALVDIYYTTYPLSVKVYLLEVVEQLSEFLHGFFWVVGIPGSFPSALCQRLSVAPPSPRADLWEAQPETVNDLKYIESDSLENIITANLTLPCQTRTLIKRLFEHFLCSLSKINKLFRQQRYWESWISFTEGFYGKKPELAIPHFLIDCVQWCIKRYKSPQDLEPSFMSIKLGSIKLKY